MKNKKSKTPKDKRSNKAEDKEERLLSKHGNKDLAYFDLAKAQFSSLPTQPKYKIKDEVDWEKLIDQEIDYQPRKTVAEIGLELKHQHRLLKKMFKHTAEDQDEKKRIEMELPAFQFALNKALEKEKSLMVPNPDRNVTPPSSQKLKKDIVQEQKEPLQHEQLPDNKEEVKQLPLNREGLKRLQDLPLKFKKQDQTWFEIIAEYSELYPDKSRDEIGTQIREDYALKIKNGMLPELVVSKRKEINAFNVAFSRQKGEKSVFADKTQGTSNKKGEQISYSSGDTHKRRQNDFLPFDSPCHSAAASSKRQKTQTQFCDELAKKLQEVPAYSMIGRQQITAFEEPFTPSTFLKENPMLQHSRNINDIAQKAQTAAIQIEHYENIIMKEKNTIEEKIQIIQKQADDNISSLRKLLEDKILATNRLISAKKQEHAELLGRCQTLTSKFNETIDQMAKKYHPE